MNQLNPALPNHDEIALCAFLIWEKEGRQPNLEQTYWLQAEAQLRQVRQQQAELAAKATRPWPPQPAVAPKVVAPKVATARAVKPAAAKPTRLASAATNAAVKPAALAKSSQRKPASAAPARKTTARR